MLRKIFAFLFKEELLELEEFRSKPQPEKKSISILETQKLLFEKQIEKANRLVEEYKKKLEEPNRNFTVLEGFDPSSEYFLNQLHEIANNKAFLFHMHMLRTDCLKAITIGDEKEAIVRQGQLKGIDKVALSLSNASKQYKDLIESKQNELQIQS